MLDVILQFLDLLSIRRRNWSERRRIVVGAAILASIIVFTVIAVQQASA